MSKRKELPPAPKYLNEPYGYRGVCANDDCIYPIEHLFKALIPFEGIVELDKERERLEKKLHKYMMKATVEKDGVRKYGPIHYYPSGLIEWKGQWHTVIEGYKSEYAPPEPEVKQPEQGLSDVEAAAEEIKTETKKKKKSGKPHNDTGLRTKHHLLYAMLRQSKGRKYVITDHHKFHIENAMKKAELFNALSDDEKKLLKKSHNFSKELNTIGEKVFMFFMRPFTGRYDSLYRQHFMSRDELIKEYSKNRDIKEYCIDYRLPILFDDEFEELENMCNVARQEYEKQKGHWNTRAFSEITHDELAGFFDKIDYKREGREFIDLRGAVKLIREEHVSYHYRWNSKTQINERHPHTYYQDTLDYSGVLPRVREEIIKLKNPNALIALEKFGFKFEKPEQEEQKESQQSEKESA